MGGSGNPSVFWAPVLLNPHPVQVIPDILRTAGMKLIEKYYKCNLIITTTGIRFQLVRSTAEIFFQVHLILYYVTLSLRHTHTQIVVLSEKSTLLHRFTHLNVSDQIQYGDHCPALKVTCKHTNVLLPTLQSALLLRALS